MDFQCCLLLLFLHRGLVCCATFERQSHENPTLAVSLRVSVPR